MNEMDRMRIRTGCVTDDSRVVSFLYDLLRDHLPAGTVEALVQAAMQTPVTFTNGHLARYAQDVAARLLGPAAAAQSEAVASG